jgi:hypothetical protein
VYAECHVDVTVTKDAIPGVGNLRKRIMQKLVKKRRMKARVHMNSEFSLYKNTLRRF